MSKESKPSIKESLSGAFLVKLGNNTLGGFHAKENAELFLEAYETKTRREAEGRGEKGKRADQSNART